MSESSSAEQLFHSICELIPAAMERHKVPGVALGITCDGREFTRGFGFTSISHPLPVDENTLFQIGSTTKTFTATAVMRLVEQGKLSLDLPVRNYLADFSMQDPAVTAELTMRHLLTHVGGWDGDYFEDTGNGDDALDRYVKLLPDLPQLTRLGTVFSYNNSAFAIAGRVIEVVTGRTCENALKELVLKPLGLNQSYFFPTDVMLHAFAVGHGVNEGQNFVRRPWQLIRASAAMGGIAASMKDQLRYARFHLGDGTAEDGTRVLSRESMRRMQTPGDLGELDFKLGLAWQIQDIDGIRHVSHGGGTFGQISLFTMTPQRNFALALTTNSNSGGFLGHEVTKDVVARFLGNPQSEPEEIAMSEEQIAEYAGHYTATLDDIELLPDAGKLIAQEHPKGGFPTRDTVPDPTKPPPFRVGLIAPDRLAGMDPPYKDEQGEFLRNSDGSIAWLRFNGRIHAPLRSDQKRA
jgi:CubicO group peptidase (beta-lactamase class C family)